MSHYPNISPAAIPQFNAVLLQMETMPGYLDDPACPFSSDVKQFFRRVAGAGPALEENIFSDSEDKLATIENQIGSLIKSLDDLAKGLTNKDHAEKLSYFKTKASLIEKLVGMQKDVFSMREMAEFQAIFLTFMEDICTKDQISELMERLDHLNSVKERNKS